MIEAELQAEVEKQLTAAGWAWHHCPRSERCRGTPGWPDLIAFNPGRVLAAELKAQDGRRSVDQIRCAARIAHSGAGYRLWRPSDLEAGIIEHEVKGGLML